MVARISVLLFLSGALWSGRSAPVEAPLEREFGPVKILLYGEIREATYAWLGDHIDPANIKAVTYSYSANFKELDNAIVAMHIANREGEPMPDDQRKAVTAIVIARRIEEQQFRGIQILSSKDIQLVAMPADLYRYWRATTSPPN